MPIKSFRDKISDGGIQTIPLSTNRGEVGYKIVKFQCMADGFGNSEMVIKIYSVAQTAATNDVDFGDNTLIGACMISQSLSGEANPEDQTIIFDNVIFNQDIHVTAAASSSADPTNYYIELEPRKLNLNENTVVTLKDIRNTTG